MKSSPKQLKIKNTYLLSGNFPVEEITLGETRYKVLKSLYYEKNPHAISRELKIARSTTIEHLESLEKKGLAYKPENEKTGRKIFGSLWKITEKGKYLIEKSVGIPVKSSHKGHLLPTHKVRGHAFIWKIKPNRKFNWKELLISLNLKYEEKGVAKTPRIILNGKKIWLGQNYITIFEPKGSSFFHKTPKKSFNNAVKEMSEDVEKIKKSLNIEFDYKFKNARKHFGFVDNPDAKYFIKKKKKIIIKDEEGEWFSIDFSDNLYKEGEVLKDDDKLSDSTGYGKLMNSHKKTKFKITPEFTLETFNKAGKLIKSNAKQQKKTQDQLNYFAENQVTHVGLMNRIKERIDKMDERDERFLKALENLPKKQ